jgi:TRAP-type C4-dicarboxylate transport system permease small subunit
MSGMLVLRSFNRAVEGLGTVCGVAAAALLFAAILVISWMVLARALGLQNYWELQTSIDFMVMAVFLGSAYTLRSKGHVAMELFENALPEKARRRLQIIGQLAGLAVCLYLAWVGFRMTAGVFQSNERALGIYQPMLWPRYAAMPVGMFLTALQYVVEIEKSLGLNLQRQPA